MLLYLVVIIEYPLCMGYLIKKYIQELKMSSTYKDESFAREYMAQWTGGSDDSFFNYDRLVKHRILVNPERTQNLGAYKDDFYLLSVDVGRLSCQTVVSVFKVHQYKKCLQEQSCEYICTR